MSLKEEVVSIVDGHFSQFEQEMKLGLSQTRQQIEKDIYAAMLSMSTQIETKDAQIDTLESHVKELEDIIQRLSQENDDLKQEQTKMAENMIGQLKKMQTPKPNRVKTTTPPKKLSMSNAMSFIPSPISKAPSYAASVVSTPHQRRYESLMSTPKALKQETRVIGTVELFWEGRRFPVSLLKLPSHFSPPSYITGYHFTQSMKNIFQHGEDSNYSPMKMNGGMIHTMLALENKNWLHNAQVFAIVPPTIEGDAQVVMDQIKNDVKYFQEIYRRLKTSGGYGVAGKIGVIQELDVIILPSGLNWLNCEFEDKVIEAHTCVRQHFDQCLNELFVDFDDLEIDIPLICDEEDYEDETPKVEKKKTPITPTTKSWRQIHFREDLPKIILRSDVTGFLLLVGIIVVWFLGNKNCFEIARQWLRLTGNLWQGNFARVGGAGIGNLLYEDKPNDLYVYASGRKNIERMWARLNLLPRHDLLAYLLTWYKGDYDRLQFAVELPKDGSDPLVFSIMSKKLEHEIKSKRDMEGNNLRWDLTFPRPRGHPKLPNSFVMYTESPEIADLIVADQDVAQALQDASDNALLAPGGVWLEELTVSDLPRTKPTTVEELDQVPKMLSMVVRIPKGLMKNIESLDKTESTTFWQLNRLVLDIADLIGQYGKGYSTSATKTKIVQSREGLRQEMAKVDTNKVAEQLAAKKAKERKEELERIARLPPAERAKAERKMEELEKKRALKKQAKRAGGKMIVG